MLASDVNNVEFSGSMNPDAVMIARFYKKAVNNNFLTRREGRPIFEDKLYIEYYPAGSTLLKMDVPAYDHHKVRFSKQWAYYQSTQTGDKASVGTPLSQWAILSPADVENLKGMKFETIENIASSSDAVIQIMGMGVAGMAPHVLRARAQAYIAAAKDTSLPQQQAEDIEALKKQIADLTAMIKPQAAEPVATQPAAAPAAQVAPAPAKPGRRVWTPEQKAAQSERLKKAREAKQNKAS